MKRTHSIGWVFVALLGCSTSAFAQSTEPPLAPAEDSGADRLDQEATALLRQGNLSAACTKYAESHTARPGTGVQMRLALCYEQSGKTASAWRAYSGAAARAKQSGDWGVAQLAQRRAQALEARLSKLTLHLDRSAREAVPFEISCDGAPLASSVLGEPLILDPGLHVIVASAPGRKRFRQTVRVGENAANDVLTISLPVLTPITLPQSSAPAPRSFPSRWSTQHTAAVISGSVGVVGVVLGAYSGLRVAAKMSDARERCGGGNTGCPPQSMALQQEAKGPARLSTAAFGVGALGIAAGVVLWLSAPSANKATHELALGLSPVIARDSSGVAMFARW